MTTQNPAHILIVDDDPNHLKTLQTIVRGWGYEVTVVDDGAKAVESVKARPFALILMDVRMAQMSGIEALLLIKQYNPAIPILIMTAYSSVDSAVEVLKAGAYDYLIKPLDFEALKISLVRALEHSGLKAEIAALKSKQGAEYELEKGGIHFAPVIFHDRVDGLAALVTMPRYVVGFICTACSTSR